MRKFGQVKKIAAVLAFSAISTAAMVAPSEASIGTITKADLSGNWQMTLSGFTGCGNSAMLANFYVDYTGSSTNVVLKTHGQCGDSTVTAQTFKVLTMSATGAGTANLSCGPGCGWNLVIQVAPDRSTFNVVDIDPVNPGNYIAGVAVHQ